MMMGRRRFVNLVAENLERAVFSVHRLNVSEHLFYPSTAEAEEAARPVVSTLGVLPPPAASFISPPLDSSWRKGQVFALVSPRNSESRILWSNAVERTLLYDLESHSCNVVPDLSYKGLDPITISVARPKAPEEDVYVMSNTGSSFQVYRFGPLPKEKLYPHVLVTDVWQLESLPQPPSLPEGASICSHALLHDGRTICITVTSQGDISSYLFDTVEREWSKAPDGWNLPFSTGAEHVPDLKVWLGLCNGGRHLCAATVGVGKPPTLKHQWEVEMRKDWQPWKVSLINLGDGRFCIFRVIHDVVPDFDDRDNVRKRLALLTGVQIISSPEGLRMVAHKSLSYIFNNEKICWVL